MRAARSPLLLNLKRSKTLLLLQLLMAAAAIAHLTLLPIATWPRLLAMALGASCDSAATMALVVQWATDTVLLPCLR
jgi:hypothetical protein